jgi:hypothetical protein
MCGAGYCLLFTHLALTSAHLAGDPHERHYCPADFMKIIAFIEDSPVIGKILRHCGLWKEPASHTPPVKRFWAPKLIAVRN